MNPLNDKQLNALKNVRLSAEQKERIHSAFHVYMEEHPLPASVRATGAGRQKEHMNNTHKRTIALGAVLIGALIGGTVAYAAEGTLPGDPLYPVKVHVTEKVRGAITIGTLSQAELELSLMERRLQEAQALLKDGRLDEAQALLLRENLELRRGNLNANIDDLKDDDQDDRDRLRSSFQATINAYDDEREALKLSDDWDDDSDDSRGRGRGSDDDNNGSDDSSQNRSASSSRSSDDDSDDDRSSSRSSNDDSGLEVEVEEEHGVVTVTTKPHGGDDDDDSDDSRGRGRGSDDDDDDDHRSSSSSSTSAASSSTSATVRTFTLSEVATHANAQSCYTTISGNVYDVTAYIPVHKGGSAQILAICGKDGSSLFSGQHAGAPKPAQALASFKIGTLAN